MLQSLLPGFRHLRAPLVAGYVWLLGFWLLLHDSSIAQNEPTSIHRRLVELANWAGRPVTLGAITLAAYLIGTLSIAATKGINRAAGLFQNARLEWLSPRYWVDKRIEVSLDDAVDRRLSEHYGDNEQFRNLLNRHLSECRDRALIERRQLFIYTAELLPDIPNLEREALQDEYIRWQLIHALVKKDSYVDSAKEDVGRLAYRLLGKEEQVYAEYDRLRSEGTFRLGLALPLAFLCFVLSYIDNWWWLAGMGVPVTFAYLAGGSFAEAELGLAAAVSSGRIELPSLERIQAREIVLTSFEDMLSPAPAELPPPYLPSPSRRWYSRFLRSG